MSPPLVSVLLPVYNQAQTLRATVRSVFAQSFDDWELLIADDASTDQTAEILATIQSPRVRVLRSGQNLGVARQRNRLIQAARGKYLANLDGDDLVAPTRLADQVAAFEARPDLEVLATGIFVLSGDQPPFLVGHDSALDTSTFRLLRAGAVIHPTLMTRRSWSLENLYRDEIRRAEDHELMARVCDQATIDRLPKPLLYYRVAEAGSRAQHMKGWVESLKIYWEYGPQKVGWPITLGLLALTAARWVRAWIGELVGESESWFLRGARPPTEAERALQVEHLAKIAATPVPGWES